MGRLTKEEMTALSRYERELLCAKENYLRSAGKAGQTLMRDIYQRVTGEPFRAVDVCGQCEFDLMKIMSGWYFEQKAEAPKPKTPKPKTRQSDKRADV